jgi:hypothetical protein
MLVLPFLEDLNRLRSAATLTAPWFWAEVMNPRLLVFRDSGQS